MGRLDLIFGNVKVKQKAIVDKIMNRLASQLPPKIKDICEWYKNEVASFNHVYYGGYERVNAALAQIIRQEEPVIRLLVSGDTIKIHIEMFDDALGGSLDQKTSTAFVHGVAKKHAPYPQLGWWRFFESGSPGTPMSTIEKFMQRSWGSDEYGFIKTGDDKGFMGKLGVAYRVGDKLKFAKPHPGVYTVGMFEKTWLDLKDEFNGRIGKAVVDVLQTIGGNRI